MLAGIFFTYSPWWIPLCILLALVYAGLFYFREKRFADTPVLRALLALLRFAAVLGILLLLLEPLLRYARTELEAPIVVLAVDNSQSVIMGPDSLEQRAEIPVRMERLVEQLSADYSVSQYTYGQRVSEGMQLDFSEPLTDMYALFAEVKNRYANRNLGAVIVAGDGIYNTGLNPRYALGASEWSLVSIALGDTTIRRDALISEVAANRLAYLGNQFPVEAVLEAHQYPGSQLDFSVWHRDEMLHQEIIEVEGEHFRKKLRLLLDAEAVGMQRYSLRIAALEGEATLVNNVREVFIDVIDSRQKVLLMAASPHPDIAAMRGAISSNENYQVEVKLLKDYDGNLESYDLVVLHQIPHSSTMSEQLRLDLLKSEKPLFAIVGMQTVVSMLPRFGLGANLDNFRGNFHDVGGSINSNFTAFQLDEALSGFLRDAPPLLAPFGEWRIANSAEVLLYQRIGSIDTEDPLLFINQNQDRKVAVLLGEGLWRWRLYDYATTESHRRFDRFVSSLIQYLALKADKRFFKLSHETSFMENERIVIAAEVYNPSYEAVNDGEVSIVFRDEEGLDYPFNFSRTETAFRLDITSLPVGNYTYTATSSRAGEKLEESGRLSVKPFMLEAADLTARHDLLRNMAEEGGGRMFYLEESEQIKAYLDESLELQPVSYSTEFFDNVLNLKWVFFIILGLLSMEWFLRKRSGNY